ncbi:MAG: histidine kinase [Bryobacterales bacterium]|nr:histidine kinase [Bryobacterales bacterium]
MLFVKLGVSASLASVLSRPAFVQRLLLLEQRSLQDRLILAIVFTIVFGTSVATRVLSRNSYQAVDLGLEGSLLCGVVGGYVSGMVSGILIGIPAMVNGEILAMPLFAGLGVVGGLLRDLAPDKEEIWRFSPFLDLSFRKRIDSRRLVFQMAFLFTILFTEFLRINLGRLFSAQYLYTLYPNWDEPHPLLRAATYGTTLFAVTLPLKVWDHTRIERKLEVQQALLIEARLAALTRQINPHFLFNTLNSVSSLIRINPEQARTMIVKLSNILRRLLRKQENLSPLREELSFIEDYLAIELVRFGDKLRFEKQIDPDTLGMLAPTMVLQPLVENSIKHGLGAKLDGGSIRIHSQAAGSRMILVVEDDGAGMTADRLDALFSQQGIGISNVNERLKVLYGNDFRFSVFSEPGNGTRIEIEIPQLSSALAAVS